MRSSNKNPTKTRGEQFLDKSISNCNIFYSVITATPVQSVPIITSVVSSNPAHWGVLDTKLCDSVCQ